MSSKLYILYIYIFHKFFTFPLKRNFSNKDHIFRNFGKLSISFITLRQIVYYLKIIFVFFLQNLLHLSENNIHNKTTLLFKIADKFLQFFTIYGNFLCLNTISYFFPILHIFLKTQYSLTKIHFFFKFLIICNFFHILLKILLTRQHVYIFYNLFIFKLKRNSSTIFFQISINSTFSS